jgi:hypothetical protein
LVHGLGHDNVWDGKARARWLVRQSPLDSGAYEQAATVFGQHGCWAEAEHLLIMRRKHALRERADWTVARPQACLPLSLPRPVTFARFPWRLAFLAPSSVRHRQPNEA